MCIIFALPVLIACLRCYFSWNRQWVVNSRQFASEWIFPGILLAVDAVK